MSDRLIKIQPGTAEWKAWLEFHRGTKNEARMLGCLGSAKHNRSARPWLAPSRLPPKFSVEKVTRAPLLAPISFPPRPGIGDGEFDAVAARLEAKSERDEGNATEQKRRHKLFGKSERKRELALASAQENRRPDIEDCDDLGVIRIEDPAESEQLVRVGRGQPMRVKVKAKLRERVVALRDDPIGQMAKRGQLGDGDESDLRLKAARQWQALHEAAEIGGARGIDPTRDIVDGGRYVEADTDQRLDAHRRLAEISRALGLVGDRLVHWILGDKLNLATVANKLGRAGAMEQKVLGHRFRECLDTLANEFGLGGVGAGPRRRRDRFDELARFGYSAPLHEAVHRARRTEG